MLLKIGGAEVPGVGKWGDMQAFQLRTQKESLDAAVKATTFAPRDHRVASAAEVWPLGVAAGSISSTPTKLATRAGALLSHPKLLA